MRRSIWMRVLAAVLIISMLAAPISAAARNPKPGYGANCMIGGIISIIRDIIRDIWDDWFDIPGDDDPEPTTPAEPTDPSEPEETDPTQPEETDPTEPGETDPSEPEQDTETVLNLIEGHSNTENGQLLRGVTYSLSQVTSAQQSQAQPQSAKRTLRSIKSMALTAVGTSVATTAEGESAKIEGISGTANSYDTGENAVVANAFDGNTNTYWATSAGGNVANCWLVADLGGEYTITEVRYTKRYDSGAGYNCTGNLLNYIIEVSTDGTNWTQVKTGDTVDGTTNIVLDNPVQATHVRLKSTSSYHWQSSNANTVMTCAEFEVYGYSANPAVDPSDASRDIPLPDLQVSCGDYETDGGDAEGPADLAVDEDASTLWHTDWQGTTSDNHWFQFQVNGDYTIDGLRYQPRQSGGTNGIITGYEIQVSDDGTTFRTVATGTWDNDSNWKIATFDAVKAKYVRLVSTDSISDKTGYVFASAAEIRLTGEVYEDPNLTVTARYMTNRLSWTAESGVTYTVERSWDNKNWTTIGTSDTGSYLDTTAGMGTQYYYRLTTDVCSTAGVQGLKTGMGALKEIAVLFYEGNDEITFDGSNKVVIAEGDKATELNALESGTIVYKAYFNDVTSNYAVLGTDTGCYVGNNGAAFRHDLGGNFMGSCGTANLTAGADNSAGFVYDDSNGHWGLCSNGCTVSTSDLNEANFGMLTGTGASTYYAGGSSTRGFNGTINYIMVLSEVLTDDELKALTAANPDHDVEASLELIYFPVTMFNYHQNTINGFTDRMDTDTTVHEGFYFSDGGTEVPNTSTASYDLSAYVAGQYYIQGLRAKNNGAASWLYSIDGDTAIQGAATREEADIWTLVVENGEYYLMNGDKYLSIAGAGADMESLVDTKTPITISAYQGYPYGVQLSQGEYYLCQWSGVASTNYGGHARADDGANGMLFYPVIDGKASDTPLPTFITHDVTSGYEVWNRWGYSSNGHVAQNMFYSGLVQDQLDENGEIVFNVNEPGIFTFDEEHPEITNDGMKDIYQYVGMPFVKNVKNGAEYYTFDSDEHGTYFADTDGDGFTDPQHGAADNYYNLYFDYKNTQGWDAMNFGDGSSNLWAPFDTQAEASNSTEEKNGNIDYHFGMRADLPFSMTANGRVKEIDDDSTPITFTFKGDDDVWIFIDGKLVIDLGGIHNRLGATIDFANNTITYEIPESNKSREKKPEAVLGSYNEPDKFPLKENGTIEIKLFNDASGEGVLGMTRDEFANDVNHEMSIFYLERGEGTSNCKIEFNLPMLDTLLVTKDATKSWSAEMEAADRAAGNGGDGTRDLSPVEQAIVDQQMFGFTLYKLEGSCFGEDGELIENAQAQFEPVSNVKFAILDKDGNVLDHRSTTDEGRFYLKNGHTAKFMIDMPRDGVSYYLVEDELPKGFLTPDYQYEGMAAYGFDYAGTRLIPGTEETETVKAHVSDAADMGEHELPLDATENNSYFITAKGSVEAIESLHFFCVNYLEHNDGSVEAHANDDIIVIDYGLPVQIDPMANDIIRGEDIVSVDIVHAINGDFNFDTNGDGIIDEADLAGLAPAGDVDGHSGTFEFHDVAYAASQSGTAAVRDTFTYTLNKQLTEVEVVSYLVKATKSVSEYGDTASVYSQAKLYVVPATIMYYEENFSNMVTYTSGGGEIVGEQREEQYVSDYQEPGVVGTIGDSTYGSDVAYLSDSHDSNGTSMKLDTTNGWVRFQYTFTGTGTSIFARTSATTGYIQVLVFEGEQVGNAGDQVDTYYRDTYWNSEAYPDDTLYNIPVYTNNDLGYGTYTVLVTVATMGTPGAGPAVDPDGDGKFVNQSQPEFYLDGIRVMQPLNEVILTQPMLDEDGNPVLDEDGEPMLEEVYDEDFNPVYDDLTVKARNAYATDGESNLAVVTLRQKLIDEFTPDYDADKGEEEPDWPFVVLTDTDGSLIKASEYESIGPKEEVYLAPGQKIRFSLKYWDPNGLKLYMGMKAPLATENGAGVIVGNKTFNLLNAADCYYDVSNCYASQLTETDEDGNEYTIITYTFEATDSIVSLTNIKVVGNFEFAIVEENDEVVDGSGTGEE